MLGVRCSFGLGGLVAASCLVLAACSTGPERGDLRVVMTLDEPASGSVASASLSTGTVAAVPLTSIESIVLTIVRVDAKPVSAPADEDSQGEGEGVEGEGVEGEGAGDTGGWVRVPVTEGTTVDLLALPTVGGQEVAEGEVVATSFKEIRLVCGGTATITLSEPVTVAGGEVIGDDEPLVQPLAIPSCESSGLKIKGGNFLVPGDGGGTAIVQVEIDATVQSISWNANGFSMDPVMKIKN